MNAPTPVSGAPSQRATAPARSPFESLVAPYAQRLYRFLVVRLGDEREARDALQETLLAAWQGLPQLRERERPWGWLAGIAANKAADSARRRVPVVPLTDTEPGYEQGGPSELAAALATLPSAAREVLLLRYLLRLSEDETAAVLGVRVGTVKSRAARARRLLLEELG